MVSFGLRNQSYSSEKVAIVCYIGLFFLAWTMYAFFILPTIKAQQSILYTFNVFKLLIWVLPVFIYLRRRNVDVLAYLKLKGRNSGAIRWTILVSLAFISYQIIGRYVFSQEIRFYPFFAIDKWLGGVILVGFTEELLFRGFLLQKISNFMEFSNANIITSILFLLSHFPGYFALNQFPEGVLLKIATFSFILIFGVVEGYVLKKTNSLWPCIIIHSISNFMAFSLSR